MLLDGLKDECVWHLDVTMGIAIVTILLTLHLLSYFVVDPKGKPNIQRNNGFKEILLFLQPVLNTSMKVS